LVTLSREGDVMLHAILELVFIAFPMTFIATIAGLMAGGYFFGPIGSGLGGLIGLICGAVLEYRLQYLIAAAGRAKWAGIIFVVGLIVTVAAVAVATR